MNQNNQLVSIILPIYNADSFLSSCLDSLLSQNYLNIEIIAIDDYSKDTSYSILKMYKRLDKRVRIARNVKRYGMSITLNRAVKEATGRYIIFMSPKDTVTRDKIRKQVQYLTDNPKTVAVGTQCLYINEQKKRIGKSYFPLDEHIIKQTLFTGFAVQSETVLIHRYLIPSDLLHFPPILDRHFTYWPIFAKLLRYGTIANLEQPLQTHMKRHDYFLSLKLEMIHYMKLWFQARFVYDLRLPLQTLFYPLVR